MDRLEKSALYMMDAVNDLDYEGALQLLNKIAKNGVEVEYIGERIEKLSIIDGRKTKAVAKEIYNDLFKRYNI